MSNLDLWEKGETTDPSFTKENKHGAGGSTSINTTYAFKRATEVFGPIGIGWGYTIVKDEIVDGATVHYGKEGAEREMVEKIHTMQIRFWYIIDGKKGEFDQFGHTDFTGKNKWGPFTESEPQKKSLSDAIKKALSMLGFNADIYLGMYDDQGYVQAVAIDIAADDAESKVELEAVRATEFRDWVNEVVELIKSAQSINTLNTIYKKHTRILAERVSFGRISQKQSDYAARIFTDKFTEQKTQMENDK